MVHGRKFLSVRHGQHNEVRARLGEYPGQGVPKRLERIDARHFAFSRCAATLESCGMCQFDEIDSEREFLPAHHQAYSNMEEVRRQWNPSDLPMSIQRPPMDRSGYGDSPDPDAAENLVGSPKRVAEQLTLMRDVGVRNLMLTNRGLMSREKTAASLKLLSEKVMPRFSNL